jgi:hypothetical protein
LQTITDFSKIGSEPKLENKDIVAETFNLLTIYNLDSQNKLNFRSKRHNPNLGFLEPQQLDH